MPSTLELPRRQLLAGGIALAALPAEASQITTPAQGLTAGEVSVPVGDFRMPAYRAQPAHTKGRLPVVLLVSEIFGVHAHIADVARRFAHAGYLCIAPELFVRQGDAARQPDVQTLVREVISKVPDAQVMADLDACLAWAGANGGDTRRVAVTGFCYGGRITCQRPSPSSQPRCRFMHCTAAPLAPLPRLSRRAITHGVALVAEHEDVDPVAVVAGLHVEEAFFQRGRVAQRHHADEALALVVAPPTRRAAALGGAARRQVRPVQRHAHRQPLVERPDDGHGTAAPASGRCAHHLRLVLVRQRQA
jgi:hypothetical protein